MIKSLYKFGYFSFNSKDITKNERVPIMMTRTVDQTFKCLCKCVLVLIKLMKPMSNFYKQ